MNFTASVLLALCELIVIVAFVCAAVLWIGALTGAI